MSPAFASETTLTAGLLIAIYACAWVVARLLATVPAIARELQVDAAQRQLCLDGLRGVLALAVVCHHWVVTRQFLRSGSWQKPETSFAGQLGQGSVALFFMITAFLFWGRLLELGPRLHWGRFYLARFFRLTPAYLVIIGCLFGVVMVETGGNLTERKLNLACDALDWLGFTIRQAPPLNHFASTWMIIAGVTWSLRYEWVFYLALPLAGSLFTGARQWVWAGLSLGLVALFLRVGRKDPIDPVIATAFLGGIVAAYWIRSKKCRNLGAHPLFGALTLAGGVYELFTCDVAYAFLPLVLLSLFFLAVVCDNRLLGFLRMAALRWLGEVSYGIYLLHGISIWITTRWIVPHWKTPSGLSAWEFVGVAAATIPLLILATSALNLLVERPGIAAGRHLASLSKKKAALRAEKTAARSSVGRPS